MNSKLFELAAKSRRTLEDGEKLCFRGTEVIKSTHGLLGDIQLLYPRLVFFQDFLDQQIEGIDTLLQLSRNQLYRLDGFLEIKSHDTDNLLKSLDLIIGRLKDSAAVHTTFFTPPKSLDANEMQADLQGSESKATLFDYVDIEAMLTCRERLTTELERFYKLRGELFELISKVQLALDEFKNTLQEEHSSISLEESGAQYAKEKSDFQERQANTMAQALLSVTSHYDQIKDALSHIESGAQTKDDPGFFILERDTEELSSISDELVQSLRIIETVHEDAIVRQQLFHMVYQEKTEFFRKISSFNSTYSELCELVKSVDSELESGGAAVEKYLEELWGLGSCYEDFMAAYTKLLEEMERRQSTALYHASIVNQYNQRLMDLHKEEIQQRIRFINSVAPFLPGDLSLFLNSAPSLYRVTQVSTESRCQSSSSINQATKPLSSMDKIANSELSSCEDDQSNGAIYESAQESQSVSPYNFSTIIEFNVMKVNSNEKNTESASGMRDSPPAPIWD